MAKLMMKWFQVLVLASGLVVASGSWSADEPMEVAPASTTEETPAENTVAYDSAAEVLGTERPSYGAVLADTLLVRPLTLTATALGAVVWVVTLPLTAVTGTTGEAGQTLIVEPFATTFFRCLGCKEVGWRKLPPAEVY